ncbi:hypothetical protein llap_9304 [Limosa lapponica baueri]|uniref:Uncharacterized protein n=1 Tax=Limosa lapponica baueri TaxID=1758121 RepID=A0A2I0U2Y9_LIMLA|nr:hypothetical protein llap_9304 [Limosa lapponica baueri]
MFIHGHLSPACLDELLSENVPNLEAQKRGERREEGEQIYDSQCPGLPVLVSASPAEIMGVWGTKNGDRRRRQKGGSP